MVENLSENNITRQKDVDEKLLKQTKERQEYMMKLKEWLDDARLWHYNFCSRLPKSNIPSSNPNIVDNILQQYASLSQTNVIHQHFQNVLLNNYNLNRNNPTSVFNLSKLFFNHGTQL